MNLPDDITIRNRLQIGDLDSVIDMHSKLYRQEYNYGSGFKKYVIQGLYDFFQQYDPKKDKAWICEHDEALIGFLAGIHRENNAAQLRYFLIAPQYRGAGLGKKLMQLFVDFLHEYRYQSAYLWTAEELTAAAALYKRFGFVLTEEKLTETFGRKVKEQRYDLKL